jgi:putative alpha-1,2-mannosidase
MDDQGSTSSWYVFGAMGFYPVNPASPDYIIGSPLFEEIKLHLGNGKELIIQAKGNSEENIYIQSATLNGQTWKKPWFSHADIANGGTFVFKMGPHPNPDWGSAPDAVPPSMTQ